MSILDRLSFRQIHKLIGTAIEENEKDHLWLYWLISNKCQEMDFKEFYNRAVRASNKTSNNEQSAEEILDKIGAKMAALGL